jgi:saposin
VKKNTDKIIELLAKQMSPKQICQQLSLCAPKKTQDLKFDEAIIVNVVAVPAFPQKIARVSLKNSLSMTAPLSDDPQCVVCEFIMTKLENELKDKSTRDEIRAAVEGICTKLPNSISKQCTKFVEQYADLIITLVDTVPPKEICAQMGLCPASKTISGPLKSSLPVSDDPQCVVCEFVMTKLENELKDKSTRDEIRAAVEGICTKLPNSISKQCTKFVEQYADLIITLVDTVPPKQICSQMGLCPAQKKEAHLVGASECTWGPSHFCADLTIAEMCKVKIETILRQRKLN